jgi:hypothetical protein
MDNARHTAATLNTPGSLVWPCSTFINVFADSPALAASAARVIPAAARRAAITRPKGA